MADAAEFIARWKQSGASERANYQLFLSELCEVLGVERPQPASDRAEANTYSFERAVKLASTGGEASTGFIDLYQRDAFVLEAMQDSDAPQETEAEALTGEKLRRKMGTARRGTRGWEMAMSRAKEQARRYARALPEGDGWPPFLIVVDMGLLPERSLTGLLEEYAGGPDVLPIFEA